MPIPELTTAGLLPEGVHVATLEEVHAAFGSANDTRQARFDGLNRFVSFATTTFTETFNSIVVDGSFVTDKPAPNDVDCVLICGNLAKLDAHPARIQLRRATIEKAYGVDLYIGPPGGPMTMFFQTLRTEEALLRGVPATQRRGVVEVKL